MAVLAEAADTFLAGIVKNRLIGGLTEATYNTAVVIMTFYFVTGMALALARHEQQKTAVASGP